MAYTQKDKDRYLKALAETRGIVTNASLATNISRNQHYEWLKEDAEYKKRVDDIDDMSIDFAETCLHKHMAGDNGTSATIFFLKCKAKKRGYRERDVDDTDKQKLTFDVSDRLSELLSPKE